MQCAGSLRESNGGRAESKTVGSTLKTFAEETSAHGIPHIILSPRRAVKLVWTILVSCACFIFVVQVSELVSNYHTFHTNIALIHSEQVQFPAVTVCNFNRMRRSKLGENSRYQDVLELENGQFWRETIDNLDNYDWLWSSDYWDELSSNTSSQLQNAEGGERENGSLKRREISSPESYLDYSFGVVFDDLVDLYNKLGDDFASKILDKIAPTKDELRTMGHQAKDFILQCNFNKAKCDYRNFTTSQNKHYGNCFTFDVTKLDEKHRSVTHSGSEYGLHLTLFIEKPQYVGLFTEESGARLVIHPQNIMPHPEDIGISITPGFATSIGLRQVELKRLGGKYGDCKDGNTENHLSSDKYNYSITSCQKKCLLDHMKEKCGCVNNIYDDYADVPNCNDGGDTNKQVRCQQQAEENFSNKTLKCYCPVPCHEYIYNTDLSTALWPSELYRPHLQDKLQAANVTAYRILTDTTTSRENLVRLSIYFKELNYECIEQVPAYTVANVLGNIGGLTGLYLGFSVLTVCEVVILFYHLSHLVFGKARANSTRK